MTVPSPQLLQIETSIHGRVLYDDRAGPASAVVVAFHGYGQSAEDMLAGVRQLPSTGQWRIVAPQALHRFYPRDRQRIVASWMTREDRDLAIQDNLEYIARVIDRIGAGASPLVCLGFSQGASMAYRTAVLGRHRVSGVIALGGDIPPEVRAATDAGAGGRRWPAVLIGAGLRDAWFNQRLDGDLAFLTSRGIDHQVVRYDGAHEWTPEFATAAGQWLDARLARTST
jgi:predicted esterase